MVVFINKTNEMIDGPSSGCYREDALEIFEYSIERSLNFGEDPKCLKNDIKLIFFILLTYLLDDFNNLFYCRPHSRIWG